MLHGCTIGDGSLIGIQAVVLNHAVIGRECLVGAGALVTEGKSFPDGTLIIGAPAKVARDADAGRTPVAARLGGALCQTRELFRTNCSRSIEESQDEDEANADRCRRGCHAGGGARRGLNNGWAVSISVVDDGGTCWA